MPSKTPKWSFYLDTDAAGRSYVKASYGVWIPEKKQPRIARRVHVGRLQDDRSVKPGKTFLETFPEYQGKEIFFWHNRLLSREEITADPEYTAGQQALRAELEEVRKLEQNEENEKNEAEERSPCLHCGRSWASWMTLKLAGIIDDLRAVFGQEAGNELANLAVYSFSTKSGAMQNYEDWLFHSYIHGAKPLDGRRITELLSLVTHEKVDAYFQKRHERALIRARAEREKLLAEQPGLRNSPLLPPLQVAFDSTSISTYSETILNAEWGKNKQGEPLRQINLCAVSDQSTGEILFAHEYQGSINDGSSFMPILERMESAGFDLSDTLLVADRGYETMFNIQRLINLGIPFVIGVPLREDAVRRRLEKHRGDLTKALHFRHRHNLYAYTCGASKDDEDLWQRKLPGGGTVTTRVFVHLYRNPSLETEKLADLLAQLEEIVQKKNNGLKVEAELFGKNRRFLKEIKEPGHAPYWTLDMDSIEKAAETMGCFCIRTNACANAEDALERYRQRQAIEEAFKRFKVYNDSSRLMSTQMSYLGRLFVFLLAESARFMLGLTARRNAELEGRMLPGNSLEKLLVRLDGVVLRRIGRNGRSWRPAMLSRQQREAFAWMGVPVPAGTIRS